MLKVFKELVSDLAISVRHVLSGIFLLAGFNVCIAAASFLTALVMGDPHSGVRWFFAVMAFQGTGLVEGMRQAVEIFNWTALGTIGIFAGYSFGQYCAAASRRPKAQVFTLRIERATERADNPTVVNL